MTITERLKKTKADAKLAWADHKNYIIAIGILSAMLLLTWIAG